MTTRQEGILPAKAHKKTPRPPLSTYEDAIARARDVYLETMDAAYAVYRESVDAAEEARR